MQPPRPFQGVSYDNDMFTFLPTVTNRDGLVESPRKRKFMASDSQFTIPAPTMGYGSYVNLNPMENAGDLRTNKLQSFVSTSSPSESLTFRNHLDNARFEHQNDSGAPWHSNERDFYESRSESRGHPSFPGQSQSNNYSESSFLSRSPAGLMYKSSVWSPEVTENFNQHMTQDSHAHVGVEESRFYFPKSQSYGLQIPTSTDIELSNSSDLVLGESQNLQEKISKPGVCCLGLDKGSYHEHSYKAETFPKIEGHGDSSSFARVDCAQTLENSFGTSIHNLGETNRILQQALRLLSASSGTSLTVSQDGSSQVSGCDVIKINSTPDSQTQNVSPFSTDGTPSKGNHAGVDLDRSLITGDKGSDNALDGFKSENGGLPLAEKLWDGTLRLSSSVSVTAVAFFKSGERMQDFSWSGSVEVKGKVRLEAFEKYIQDLPRSRSRGLMVMSLWGKGKDGSSATSLQAMTEIARKYREGKKVGFAQLNKGLDVYICPQSDTVITILAKHGFFNGMTAVTEKSAPLIGCVVWRKHSTSAPTTEATVIDPSHSGTSPNKQSEGNSEKMQSEIIKHNSLLTPVPDQSKVLSDDEDLPEYDFEAGIIKRESSGMVSVSLRPETEQVSVSHVNQPIADEMRSESSTLSRTLPDPRFQGVPQNMKHQSELYNSGIQAQQETQSRDRIIAHQPETMIPGWPIEEKRPVNDCVVTMKPESVFDDDDIPEWCPPDLKTTTPERPRPGPSLAPRFSFTDLATGRQLPTPPPLPPLPPPRQLLTSPPLPPTPRPSHILPTPSLLPPTPRPGDALPPPPPLPPTPHPDHRPQFSNNDHSVPRFPIQAVNNFVHNNRPVAPPTHARFQDQGYPPTPSIPDDTTVSNFMHKSPAYQSHSSFAPFARPQLDRREAECSRHEVLPLPPGFNTNLGSRPQLQEFQQPRVNNHASNSAWRSSRP